MLLDVGSLLKKREEVPPDQVRLATLDAQDVLLVRRQADEVERVRPADAVEQALGQRNLESLVVA